MAFTSTFYNGSVDEVAWSTGGPRVSSIYGVLGANDMKVTAVAGQDRTVSVAVGACWGKGVHDVHTPAETVALPVVASGSRWDLIAVRRNWSTNTTTIVRVNGSATRGIPAGRLNGYGTVDDQPLALVRVQSGSTLIQEIIDLRCWAGPGGMEATDLMARDYLAFPGARVKVGVGLWSYSPGTNNVFGWTDIAGTSASTANTAMRRDAANVTSVGAMLLTSGQGSDSRSATRKDYVDQQVGKLATPSLNGAMSAADKRKMDAATSVNSGSTFMARDGSGRARVNDPSNALDIANKRYVDGLTPRKSASGGATMTFPAGAFFGAVTVNLPAGFASTPRVTVQLTSNIGWPALKLSQPMVVSKTATSFQIRCGTVDGQPTGVTFNFAFDWIAILH